jgi:hypothetical protein
LTFALFFPQSHTSVQFSSGTANLSRSNRNPMFPSTFCSPNFFQVFVVRNSLRLRLATIPSPNLSASYFKLFLPSKSPTSTFLFLASSACLPSPQRFAQFCAPPPPQPTSNLYFPSSSRNAMHQCLKPVKLPMITAKFSPSPCPAMYATIPAELPAILHLFYNLAANLHRLVLLHLMLETLRFFFTRKFFSFSCYDGSFYFLSPSTNADSR